MQTAFGVLVILGCMVWGCYHLAEMLGLTEEDDRIDRCPHCGDWVKRSEKFFVEDNEIYHGYCWDKVRGDLQGVLHAHK